MPQDATERLVTILEGAPEYLLGFMADFGGDTSDYIEVAEGEEIDFARITPAQVGNALRLYMDAVPLPGLPTDLDITEVSWQSLGAQVDQILMTAMEGM